MASAIAVFWSLATIAQFSSGQTLSRFTGNPVICKDVVCTSLATLSHLDNCTVILGNLRISLMENTSVENFQNYSFPMLREVTGFVVLYRVTGLDSLARLFPNLARIRGRQLISNFGLIIYDMPNLQQIGLYNLLKIDRGGVIINVGPNTSYLHTIDWETIAPRARHVVTRTIPDLIDTNSVNNTFPATLPQVCRCSLNSDTNHCWNNIKCQRYLEGPDADDCHEQCIGCRKTNKYECTVCRHFTYRDQCVSRCPKDTIVIRENNYCINASECADLNGWVWNNSCVFECPLNYSKHSNNGTITCINCGDCEKICGSLNLQTLSALQQASRCVKIDGFLTIRIWNISDIMEELRTHLSLIKEVYDYINVYSSVTITSLDFLPSLKKIGGRKLFNGTYSLVIRNMPNLHSLFTKTVTSKLYVEKGRMWINSNPKLCPSEIDEIKYSFPNHTNFEPWDAMNGYDGNCVAVNLTVRVLDQNTAMIFFFNAMEETDIQYTVLYAKVPHGKNIMLSELVCSEMEWQSLQSPQISNHLGITNLTDLQPASTYMVFIETHAAAFEIFHETIIRSKIITFKTAVGRPKPSMVTELRASSSETVILHWVDHKDYKPHITHYEIDVKLIEIRPKDITTRNHCEIQNIYTDESDNLRHAVILRPTSEYEKICESRPGFVCSFTASNRTEDHFDICSSLDSECDKYEDRPPGNSSFGKYVRSLILHLKGPRNNFQVSGLAPFRDYKFRLRACAGKNCSRSFRGVVRTLRSEDADIPSITYLNILENGHISVNWQPPNVTNGPVLAYFVQVIAFNNKTELILPQSWCFLPNVFSFKINWQTARKYSLRVCSSTLGCTSACTNWSTIEYPTVDYGSVWAGIACSFILLIGSLIMGYLSNRDKDRSDVMPLMDYTSMYPGESEPPNEMMTDFMTLYTVPLRDTLIDY